MSQFRQINRRSFMKGVTAGGLAITSLSTLAACGDQNKQTVASTPTDGPDPSDATAINVTVTDGPDANDTVFGPVFKTMTRAFHKKYPHYRITGDVYRFLPDTFYDRMTSGRAQDLNRVYLTESRKMIEMKYAADITDTVKKWQYFQDISSFILPTISNSQGQIFAVPKDGYRMALVYRRDIFKNVGLNPDKPPQTWDDFRSAASLITKKIGAPGYIMQNTDRVGGLLFTNWLYSAGGKVEELDSSGNWKCVANSDAGYAVLQMLHDMCWKDGSLINSQIINDDTADRKLDNGLGAMKIGTIDEVMNNPSKYGVGPMPCTNGANAVLTGGDIWTVNAHSSPDIQQAAAEYALLSLDPQYYEALLKSEKAAGQAIGYTDPTVFSGDYAKQIHDITKKYTTISEKAYAPLFALQRPGVLEPPVQPQEWYSRMDDVIQNVYANASLNVKSALDQVVTAFQHDILDPVNQAKQSHS